LNHWEILLLALALAADAFSVGVGVGLSHQRTRQVFRLSFHFGLFQGLLATAGLAAGSLLIRWIHAWDHWIAFGLLVLIGLRMIRGAFGPVDERADERDLTRGWSLVMLSTAVSIDAFAAGVGIAALEAPRVEAVLLIALVSGLATLLAFRASTGLRRVLGHRAELVGGLVLIALGSKILMEHLAA